MESKDKPRTGQETSQDTRRDTSRDTNQATNQVTGQGERQLPLALPLALQTKRKSTASAVDDPPNVKKPRTEIKTLVGTSPGSVPLEDQITSAMKQLDAAGDTLMYHKPFIKTALQIISTEDMVAYLAYAVKRKIIEAKELDPLLAALHATQGSPTGSTSHRSTSSTSSSTSSTTSNSSSSSRSSATTASSKKPTIVQLPAELVQRVAEAQTTGNPHSDYLSRTLINEAWYAPGVRVQLDTTGGPILGTVQSTSKVFVTIAWDKIFTDRLGPGRYWPASLRASLRNLHKIDESSMNG